MAKTEAGKILEARQESYGNLPSGWVDETTLLLMSQDVCERLARQKKLEKK
jgi:hypothetical protein